MSMLTPDIIRPDRALIEGLRTIGSATAAGELYRLGIKNPHMAGLTTWIKGKSVVQASAPYSGCPSVKYER